MKPVRILHTSDVHIGARFEFLGARGEEQREAVRAAFGRITQLCKSQGYDLLLIAGDLFESAYQVSERDLAFTIGALSETGGCRTVILPGSHDFWAPGTVYERERDRFEASGAVHLVTPERTSIVFDDLSLAVHARALTTPAAPELSVADLEPEGFCSWNILMVHGSVEGAAGINEPGDNRIDLKDLRKGFDYVALGHWHSYLVVRDSDPPVLYSGAPELLARDQRGSGAAVSVTLSDGRAVYERVPVGIRRIERHRLDCTGLDATEGLVRAVLAGVPEDPDAVLELSFTGVIGVEAAIDPALAVDELESHYFSVRLAGPGPDRAISREDLESVPEASVAGRFVRDLTARIEGAGEGEREELEEALQIGYQLFMGRNPLG
ncbi:MAG: DNA repair exonuclease [bacterium]|nr:MAG: DNA repair exonuclease [bacterium]